MSLSWSILHFAWRPMVAATALCLVPAYLVTLPITATFSPAIDTWALAAQRAQALNLPQPDVPANFETSVLALLGTAIVMLTASLIATAALVRIGDAVFRGESMGAGGAVRDGLSRLLALLAGQVLYAIGVVIILMLGLMLAGAFIAGGGLFAFLGLVVLVGTVAGVLFYAVRTTLLSQAVVIERKGGGEGLGRSWRIVSGSGWRVLGYVILITLLNVVLGLVVDVCAALIGVGGARATDYALRGSIQALAMILIMPIETIVFTLLYFDLRWRRGESVPRPGGGEVAGRPQTEEFAA